MSIKKLLLLLALTNCAFADLPVSPVIEVRVGSGNDLNSGMYSDGTGAAHTTCSGGTDWTQQNSPQVTFNGTTVTATTAGVGAVITITGYTVLTTDKCNTLRIASGTNYTASLYQITTVSTGANTWTLDRNVTTGAGVGMVGRMGGALNTLQQAAVTDVAINSRLYAAYHPTIWLKSATITLTSTMATGPMVGGVIRGYDVTRGDHTGTRPIITTATNSTDLFRPGQANIACSIEFENVVMTNTATIRAQALSGATDYLCSFAVTNSMLDGFATGIYYTSANSSNYNAYITNTEIKNCTTAGVNLSTMNIKNSYIHDNQIGVIMSGVFSGAHSNIDNTIFDSNVSYGFQQLSSVVYVSSQITNSAFYNNMTGGGVNPANLEFSTSSQGGSLSLINNVFEGGTNGVWLADAVGSSGNLVRYNNAFYNTTPYVGSSQVGYVPAAIGDITLTGSPWISPAAGNFNRNTTAGAGAALTGAGFPSSITSAGVGATSIDVGPTQSAGTTAGAVGYASQN